MAHRGKINIMLINNMHIEESQGDTVLKVKKSRRDKDLGKNVSRHRVAHVAPIPGRVGPGAPRLPVWESFIL